MRIYSLFLYICLFASGFSNEDDDESIYDDSTENFYSEDELNQIDEIEKLKYKFASQIKNAGIVPFLQRKVMVAGGFTEKITHLLDHNAEIRNQWFTRYFPADFDWNSEQASSYRYSSCENGEIDIFKREYKLDKFFTKFFGVNIENSVFYQQDVMNAAEKFYHRAYENLVVYSDIMLFLSKYYQYVANYEVRDLKRGATSSSKSKFFGHEVDVKHVNYRKIIYSSDLVELILNEFVNLIDSDSLPKINLENATYTNRNVMDRHKKISHLNNIKFFNEKLFKDIEGKSQIRQTVDYLGTGELLSVFRWYDSSFVIDHKNLQQPSFFFKHLTLTIDYLKRFYYSFGSVQHDKVNFLILRYGLVAKTLNIINSMQASSLKIFAAYFDDSLPTSAVFINNLKKLITRLTLFSDHLEKILRIHSNEILYYQNFHAPSKNLNFLTSRPSSTMITQGKQLYKDLIQFDALLSNSGDKRNDNIFRSSLTITLNHTPSATVFFKIVETNNINDIKYENSFILENDPSKSNFDNQRNKYQFLFMERLGFRAKYSAILRYKSFINLIEQALNSSVMDPLYILAEESVQHLMKSKGLKVQTFFKFKLHCYYDMKAGKPRMLEVLYFSMPSLFKSTHVFSHPDKMVYFPLLITFDSWGVITNAVSPETLLKNSIDLLYFYQIHDAEGLGVYNPDKMQLLNLAKQGLCYADPVINKLSYFLYKKSSKNGLPQINFVFPDPQRIESKQVSDAMTCLNLLPVGTKLFYSGYKKNSNISFDWSPPTEKISVLLNKEHNLEKLSENLKLNYEEIGRQNPDEERSEKDQMCNSDDPNENSHIDGFDLTRTKLLSDKKISNSIEEEIKVHINQDKKKIESLESYDIKQRKKLLYPAKLAFRPGTINIGPAVELQTDQPSYVDKMRNNEKFNEANLNANNKRMLEEMDYKKSLHYEEYIEDSDESLEPDDFIRFANPELNKKRVNLNLHKDHKQDMNDLVHDYIQKMEETKAKPEATDKKPMSMKLHYGVTQCNGDYLFALNDTNYNIYDFSEIFNIDQKSFENNLFGYNSSQHYSKQVLSSLFTYLDSM